MLDVFRQTAYLGFVLFIIGSVWALGWVRAMDDQVPDYSTPATPALYDPARDPDPAAGHDAMIFTPRETPDDFVTSMQDPNDL
jgi:hypothetical protein